MRNSWTGGQYSLFRVLFALYLSMHFLGIFDRSEATPMLASPMATTILRAVAAALCLCFGIGQWDRATALGPMVLGLYLHGFEEFILFILLVHVLTPAAPYGSWAARGRVDPGGGWQMPPHLFAAVWIVLSLSYAYDGYRNGAHYISSNEDIPFALVFVAELAIAPAALLSRIRPWLWGAMLMLQLFVLVRFDFAFVNLGRTMVHLLAFDPGWIRPFPGGTESLFYDGYCGLCQRSVRLILAEDTTGAAFRFAPLQGETFSALLTEAERKSLPMSLVVQTEKSLLLTRSSGVLHILRRLGGIWRLLAGALVLLPAAVRDGLYDGIARIRHRIFARPAEACPLMPPSLRARFDP